MPESDEIRQELLETEQALDAAKRQVVASAIRFTLEQVVRPKQLASMTRAELELLRRIAQLRPEWKDASSVDLNDEMAGELIGILTRVRARQMETT